MSSVPVLICEFCGSEIPLERDNASAPPRFCDRRCWRASLDPVARFWAKVDQNGPVPEDCPELGPCWRWLGALFLNGYGAFRLNGTACYAHIVSYEWHAGPANGLQVQHACNVRRCVNPSHLSLGDRERNMRYAASLGRLPRGERVHFAILTEAEAREVRRLASTGMPKKDIAIRYGISERTVRDIRNGRSWKHLL